MNKFLVNISLLLLFVSCTPRGEVQEEQDLQQHADSAETGHTTGDHPTLEILTVFPEKGTTSAIQDEHLAYLAKNIGADRSCELKSAEYYSWFLSLLNRDLKTAIFDQVKEIQALAYPPEGSKCITVEAWTFEDSEAARKALDAVSLIPNTTIHYKPPMNWIWLKHGNRIYFIHSESYVAEAAEMDKPRSFLVSSFSMVS